MSLSLFTSKAFLSRMVEKFSKYQYDSRFNDVCFILEDDN